MNKARKELAKLFRSADVVLELRDARIPRASSNPMLAELCGDLPQITVLTKADLADEQACLAWQSQLSQELHRDCLLSTLDKPVSTAQLMQAAEKLITRPGQVLPDRAVMVVVGIPNVGKSTLVNALLGRKLANTGDEPAVTKGQQRVRQSERWYLIDTPGLLWPKLADQDGAYRLAMLGSIKNTAIELDDVGFYCAEFLLDNHRDALEIRYTIGPEIQSAEALCEHIAKIRGATSRGAVVNWHKVADVLLNDLRSGRLGRLTLEPVAAIQNGHGQDSPG